MRHRLTAAIVIVAFSLLVGAGCVSMPEPVAKHIDTVATGLDAATGKTPAKADLSEPWHEVAKGVEKTVLADSQTPAKIVLYRFAPDAFTVKLLSDTVAPKAVSAWAKSVGGEALVVNGTYFNEDQTPSGFVALGGQRIGTRSFDLDKSGLLVFQPTFRIVDTKRETVELDAAALGEAAQSYPFFVSNGNTVISQDSGQLSRRTFIGQDKEGRLYVGVVPDGFVSLYALMKSLYASGDTASISWTNVLNLDGGPSTGLVSTFGKDGDVYDSFDAVPNAIAVVRK